MHPPPLPDTLARVTVSRTGIPPTRILFRQTRDPSAWVAWRGARSLARAAWPVWEPCLGCLPPQATPSTHAHQQRACRRHSLAHSTPGWATLP